ncbi:MAG: MFS transporter, partial [Mediterranea sp.]|nr:MFS transporter [Mediterranea sp.]
MIFVLFGNKDTHSKSKKYIFAAELTKLIKITSMNNSPLRAEKGFTRAFWVSTTVELFERMAYYAVFIVLTIYLSNILGFNDFEASMISGLFSGGLYLLPIFSGAYADKIGFRKSMIIAFTLLTSGYLGLAVLPTFLEASGLVSYGASTHFNGLADSWAQWIIVPVLFVLMVGGSFIKSIISGSVAKETTEATRARGYSIFYMMVNIGAFTGKTVIDPLRNAIGEQAYIYINY